MSAEHISDQSPSILSSRTSLSHSSSRIDRLESSIRVLEHHKQEVRLKKEELRACTAMQCSQLKLQLVTQKQRLDDLQCAFNSAKEQGIQLSRLASSRVAQTSADALEQKFEQKKQLTIEKAALLGRIQENCELLQTTVKEQELCRQSLDEGSLQQQTKLESELRRLKQVSAQWKQKLTALNEMLPQSQLAQSSSKQSQSKKILTEDTACIAQKKARQLELQATHREHLREYSKLSMKSQQEAVRNQQTRKKLKIVSSEVEEGHYDFEEAQRQYDGAIRAAGQLREGIAYLQDFYEETLLVNSKRKAQCSSIWKKCKEAIARLNKVEQLFLLNNAVISDIHKLCNRPTCPS